MRIFLLIAFVDTVICGTIQLLPAGEYPPQSDPNVESDQYHSIARDPNDPKPAFDRPSMTRAAADATCDLNAVAAASGDTLVNLVKGAPPNCIKGIFSFTQTDPRLATTCSEADMSTIAKALYGVAYNYDAAKTSGSPGILNFAVYLRGCYFSLGDKKTALLSANLLTAVRYAVDAYLKRQNLEAQGSTHYEIMSEIISLISNSHDYLYYTSTLAQLLTKVSKVWTFPKNIFIGVASQSGVVNDMYDIFFRSHREEKPATEFYCKHPEVAQSLNDFMDKQTALYGTSAEWILRNTGGELARFMKYQCIYPQVSGWVSKQLAKYPQNTEKSYKMWAAMASKLVIYDLPNCNKYYGICTFKTDIEKKILPMTKVCNKTYTDTFKIRAQQMSEAEAVQVCQRLKEQESYFHTLAKTNWKPVVPDTNTMIEVVVYNDSEDYKFYNSLMFGVDTNNGGLYMEGNPATPGNVARYFCYEQLTDKGQFDVWNLEHEFTHYLDGRYDMQGGFYESSTSGHTIWWIEGFAEYASKKNSSPTMVKVCKDKTYPLSTIFANNYSSGTERVYHYGYVAARFMFERHRADVDKILGFFRAGQYTQFESFITGIGNRYDTEFSNWCTCIANGKPC